MNHTKLAEEVGTSAPYVSKIVNCHKQIVNKTFLSMMEKLGYNVRLTYERIGGDRDE